MQKYNIINRDRGFREKPKGSKKHVKSLFHIVNRKENNLRTLDNLGLLGFDCKKKIPLYTMIGRKLTKF